MIFVTSGVTTAVTAARFLLLLPLWLAMLAGCATRPEVGSIANPDFASHSTAVLARTDWQLSGRLNVRQQNQSDTVNINWQQQAERFDITLSSTILGLGTTRVTGSDSSVVVEKAGEAPVTLPSLQALTRDYLSFDFPATHLLYWVRGLPVPGLGGTLGFDTDNLLSTLTQDDGAGRRWQLTYDRYAAVDSVPLPGRIRLVAGELQLTFLIREWQLSPSAP